MKEHQLTVIGGGPAGLSAALSAWEAAAGIDKVFLLLQGQALPLQEPCQLIRDGLPTS